MEKINIAELLKDCPQGMELDCTICNNVVTLEGVDKEGYYPIRVMSKDGFHHILTCEGYVYEQEDAKCVIFPKGKNTWEGFVPPCKFKDGDIINKGDYIAIVSYIEPNGLVWYYCWYDMHHKTFKVKNDYGIGRINDGDKTRFATEEEKQKLFQAIKDNGYKWNAETKTLEKLTEQKFDITTLKPFDKVLVRDNDEQMWTTDIFSFYNEKHVYHFMCVGHYTNQCIPYEQNKHLLGTTDDCDEFYKTWEE